MLLEFIQERKRALKRIDVWVKRCVVRDCMRRRKGGRKRKGERRWLDNNRGKREDDERDRGKRQTHPLQQTHNFLCMISSSSSSSSSSSTYHQHSSKARLKTNQTINNKE